MEGENENNDEVIEHIERVEVTPAEGDDDETVDENDNDTDSEESEGDENGAADENSGDESPDGKPEGIRQRQKAPVIQTPAKKEPANPHNLVRLPDESPKEFALRLELAKTRNQLRNKNTSDLASTMRQTEVPAKAPAENSPEMEAILKKYKVEDINALSEVFPVLAAKLGFVRKDEIAGTAYADRAQTELDGFIEDHPEYLPENDPEGALWGAFKDEFAQYKQPTNAKDYKRLFQKVHQSVFGIQPDGILPKVNAQQRKVQVAAHAGASGSTTQTRVAKPTRAAGPAGLRTDMLKGFTDEEKARIVSRARGE